MYINPESRRSSQPQRTNTMLQRLLPCFVLVGSLTVVLGCEMGMGTSGCHCNITGVNAVTEPMLFGPFDYAPSRIDDHAPTVDFDTNAERMYFLWGHPDASGASITFRIYGQTLGFDPPGVMLAEHTSVPDAEFGHFYFEMPEGGWPDARYRVECELDGTAFGAVVFDIGPGADRQ